MKPLLYIIPILLYSSAYCQSYEVNWTSLSNYESNGAVGFIGTPSTIVQFSEESIKAFNVVTGENIWTNTYAEFQIDDDYENWECGYHYIPEYANGIILGLDDGGNHLANNSKIYAVGRCNDWISPGSDDFYVGCQEICSTCNNETPKSVITTFNLYGDIENQFVADAAPEKLISTILIGDNLCGIHSEGLVLYSPNGTLLTDIPIQFATGYNDIETAQWVRLSIYDFPGDRICIQEDVRYGYSYDDPTTHYTTQRIYTSELDELFTITHNVIEDEFPITFSKYNDGIYWGHSKAVINDNNDAKIVRLNESGNLINQWILGGSGDDRIKQMIVNDNEIIFNGLTNSIDGDLMDAGYHYGTGYVGEQTYDIWMGKIDLSTSALINSKCFGGSRRETVDMHQSPNGFYLIGRSDSPEFLNPFGYHSTPGQVYGTYDAIVLFLDTSFNLLNGQCFGGSSNDDFDFFSVMNENQIVAGGSFYSNDGDLVNSGNFDNCDFPWLMNISLSPSVTISNPNPIYLPNTFTQVFDMSGREVSPDTHNGIGIVLIIDAENNVVKREIRYFDN